MHFSELAHRLDCSSSEAWKTHDRAINLQQRGEDVVVLSIGDPDFRTPDPIIENAVSQMRVGRTHYSPALGELNLRRAVADYETRVSAHPCDFDEVSIYPGVTAALYAVMSCVLNGGDEVVVVDPWYVGYAPIMKALNVSVKFVPTHSADRFEPQFDDFVTAITDKTKVILLNTPGNPTGAIIPRQTLHKLAQHCARLGIWLVCDEVYSMFTYEKPHISLRSAADTLDNVVVIDGLSKSHAMSGWRMGWAVAPVSLTQHLGRFSEMSTFGCPQFIQDAAAFALNNDEYYVADMCKAYQARRDLVCGILGRVPKINYIRPAAGMFVMVDISSVESDDKIFAENLLEAELLSVLPGSAFGNALKGYVRLSLVQPEEVLQTGCKRLEKFIQHSAAK